jgi:hypothetical protein
MAIAKAGSHERQRHRREGDLIVHLVCCCIEQSYFDEDGNEQRVPCALDATGDDGLCNACREGCTLVNTIYTEDLGTVIRRHVATRDLPKSAEESRRLAEERRDR